MERNKTPNGKGKSSEPNLHDFGFQPFIFQGVEGFFSATLHFDSGCIDLFVKSAYIR